MEMTPEYPKLMKMGTQELNGMPRRFPKWFLQKTLLKNFQRPRKFAQFWEKCRFWPILANSGPFLVQKRLLRPKIKLFDPNFLHPPNVVSWHRKSQLIKNSTHSEKFSSTVIFNFGMFPYAPPPPLYCIGLTQTILPWHAPKVRLHDFKPFNHGGWGRGKNCLCFNFPPKNITFQQKSNATPKCL